jgi:hypothetical protein
MESMSAAPLYWRGEDCSAGCQTSTRPCMPVVSWSVNEEEWVSGWVCEWVDRVSSVWL